ncbi:MAG: UMP kinase [Methanobacteriota archaeon]|nr:MAG: UMP kinase [Euryarchaeota archaeon]
MTSEGGKVFPEGPDSHAVVPLERVVISLGGSILVPGDGDGPYLTRLAALLSDLSSGRKIFAVTGGGRISRYYIETGRSLGARERRLDELGIEVTRMNARLLAIALGKLANPEPAKTYTEATRLARRHPIVVMGGTAPGWTTDRVAASLARVLHAERLVNATSVDGVYAEDPKENPFARRFQRLTHQELIDLMGEGHTRAAPAIVFDPVAARVIAQAKIPLLVVHGRDLDALRGAILGETFHGTTVTG